jgi:hypothetical protein
MDQLPQVGMVAQERYLQSQVLQSNMPQVVVLVSIPLHIPLDLVALQMREMAVLFLMLA